MFAASPRYSIADVFIDRILAHGWRELSLFSRTKLKRSTEIFQAGFLSRNDEMTAPRLSQSIYERFGLIFHEQKWHGCDESSDGSKLPPSIVRWSGSQTAQKWLEFCERCLRENEQFWQRHFHRRVLNPHGKSWQTEFPPQMGAAKVKRSPKASIQGPCVGRDI